MIFCSCSPWWRNCISLTLVELFGLTDAIELCPRVQCDLETRLFEIAMGQSIALSGGSLNWNAIIWPIHARYPDLFAAYLRQEELNIAQWGKRHFENLGKDEDRFLLALPVCWTPLSPNYSLVKLANWNRLFLDNSGILPYFTGHYNIKKQCESITAETMLDQFSLLR